MNGLKSNKVLPEAPQFKENDLVRLTRKIEQAGTVFKKGCVGDIGDIGDIQISALSGRVTYEVVFHKKGKSALVDPEDIISHRPGDRPQNSLQVNGSASPPIMPDDVAYAHVNGTKKQSGA